MNRPAFAEGELNLPIPPLDRKLAITATPDKVTLEPGEETNVSIDVKDAAGQSVKDSEVALVVVDEAILALTSYKLSDPLAAFYPQRDEDVSDYKLRESVVLTTLKPGEGTGGHGAGGGGGVVRGSTLMAARLGMIGLSPAPPPNMPPAAVSEEEKIRVRSNFVPLAAFVASVRTDANGHANVKVKLPDNLTRYRVTAVAVAGEKQFGIGESAITARIPIMIRPSAPRFLNFGDRFELPVVIQNQVDSPTTVDVVIRANSSVRFVETTNVPKEPAIVGRRVMIAANDRVELRVPTIASKSGTARFQIGVVAGRWTDGAEISLPVLTPATTESFATYGEIDNGAIMQVVKAPAEAVVDYGGLEVGTSSTQVQQLTDAFLYLRDYPYECAEQLASRILSFAALRDVLAAFKVSGWLKPGEVEAAVANDLRRLQGMQNDDGGFGFWKKDDESWPYLECSCRACSHSCETKQLRRPRADVGEVSKVSA